MCSKDRLSHTRELFKESKVLNVYQVNAVKPPNSGHTLNSQQNV